jgi:hypothetical protein
VGDGSLECGMLVEVAVMVVHTTTCRDVATGKVSICDAMPVLVNRPGRAVHARHATHTRVTCQPARTEAGIATPVVALRHGLLEGGEPVEVAVMVVDTTTDHGVATGETGTNHTSTVGVCGVRPARKMGIPPVVGGPTAEDPGAHVVPALGGPPPPVAVAPSAEVLMLATVVTSVVTHAVPTEAVLVNEKTAGHVGVVPVATVGHVVRLTEVDGVPVVPAVGWVVAHRLPATTVLGTALAGSEGVVATVMSVVPHLAESVTTSWHAIPARKPDVVVGANNAG